MRKLPPTVARAIIEEMRKREAYMWICDKLEAEVGP